VNLKSTIVFVLAIALLQLAVYTFQDETVVETLTLEEYKSIVQD